MNDIKRTYKCRKCGVEFKIRDALRDKETPWRYLDSLLSTGMRGAFNITIHACNDVDHGVADLTGVTTQ